MICDHCTEADCHYCREGIKPDIFIPDDEVYEEAPNIES